MSPARLRRAGAAWGLLACATATVALSCERTTTNTNAPGQPVADTGDSELASGPPAPPPPSLVGTTGVSPLSAAELDEAADEATITRMLGKAAGVVGQRADLNNRPIHLWFLRDVSGDLDGLFVVGHAEHECCAKVSGALHDTRASQPALEDWTSYGVALLTVKDDAAQRAALDKLSEDIDGLVAHSTCAGQVAKHELDLADVRAFEAEIARKARRTCELAAEVDRPIAAHVTVAEVPAFVPLYRQSDGAPVSFELTNDELQLSDKLRGKLTVDQVARARRELKWELDRVDKLLALIPHSGPSAGETVAAYNVGVYEIQNDAAQVHATISAATKKFERLATWCRNEVAVKSILGHPDELHASSCGEVEDYIAENRRAISSLPRSGVAQATFNQLDSITTEPNPFSSQLPELRNAKSEYQRQLRVLKGHRVSAKADGVPTLIDALLRGWPATFTKASLEREYDRWAELRQPAVWAAALNSLRARHGYSGAAAGLLASNVYFEVARSGGDRFEITPHYIHDSDFYIVCKPGDGFASYESVTSDDNLLGFDDTSSERETTP